MDTTTNKSDVAATDVVISWAFAVIFTITGVLNLILVATVPGIIYLLLAGLYLPQTSAFIKKRSGFSVPISVKIIVGLVVLWGTLAVGDLAEVLGL